MVRCVRPLIVERPELSPRAGHRRRGQDTAVFVAAGADRRETPRLSRCRCLAEIAAPASATGLRGNVEQLVAQRRACHSADRREPRRGTYVADARTRSRADLRRSRSQRKPRRNAELGTLKSVAETTPLPPRVELTTVGESPRMHAAIVRPSRLSSRPKISRRSSASTAGRTRRWCGVARSRYLLDQWLAEQGFIVVSIDGRGTPARGREWERAIKGNLIDVPLADQVAGLRALAAKYPEMDLERVGIYGWSFGGYFSAMAVLRRARRVPAPAWPGRRSPTGSITTRITPSAIWACRSRTTRRLRGQLGADLRQGFAAAAAAHSRHRGRQCLLPAQRAAGRRAVPRRRATSSFCRSRA